MFCKCLLRVAWCLRLRAGSPLASPVEREDRPPGVPGPVGSSWGSQSLPQQQGLLDSWMHCGLPEAFPPLLQILTSHFSQQEKAEAPLCVSCASWCRVRDRDAGGQAWPGMGSGSLPQGTGGRWRRWSLPGELGVSARLATWRKGE